ncbi:hypothetical protein [Marinobacter adhaerens]|jgi:hypothetical protein|uniref:hypothetical protein n=1 Tax=Marinobacter adhaerens TaxID=1033846 RepID=UPI003BABFB55
MKSGFTHGIDSLKRINGNSPHDKQIAQTAVQEMEQFIHDQTLILDEYLDLKRVLTADSAAEIRSRMISLRHVMNGLDALGSFHQSGQLNEIFDIPRYKAEEAIKNAEAKAEQLIAIAEC